MKSEMDAHGLRKFQSNSHWVEFLSHSILRGLGTVAVGRGGVAIGSMYE